MVERTGRQSYEISKHQGCLKFLKGNLHITLLPCWQVNRTESTGEKLDLVLFFTEPRERVALVETVKERLELWHQCQLDMGTEPGSPIYHWTYVQIFDLRVSFFSPVKCNMMVLPTSPGIKDLTM